MATAAAAATPYFFPPDMTQTSLIKPVESPNFSSLTPARCAMVSRMFA